MAKYYYNIEVVTWAPLSEEEIQETEDLIKRVTPEFYRVSTEYVDSEG